MTSLVFPFLPVALSLLLSGCGVATEKALDSASAGDASGTPRDAAGDEMDTVIDAGVGPHPDAGHEKRDAAVDSRDSMPIHFACAEEDWKLNRVDAGELMLQVGCRANAPGDGPLAVLLHGYPESHLAWNVLATRLVTAGFVVVAPDQRGYAGSDKPEAVEAYHVDHAVNDLLGVLQASGRTRMLLIGHDWGGLVSFVFTHRHPERVHGLVIMNAPHPDIWGHRDVDPIQADATDGYVPLIMGPFSSFTRTFMEFSLSPHLSSDEVAQYRAQWDQPNAFDSMNKWYSANLHPEVKLPSGITIERPTLAIWSMDDAFVTSSELDHLPKYVNALTVQRLSGVDHWVTHQRTDEVFGWIRDFQAQLP